MNNQLVGVIGAGVMGQGLAYQCTKFGYQVVLVDVSEELLKEAEGKIRNLQRHDIMMQRMGKTPAGKTDKGLAQISYSTALEDLSEAFFIIENVPEKWEIKEQVYTTLRNIVADDCIVGVNTSATSITRLAALMKTPENVLGVHFSNPVYMMPTVEMIRGFLHSQEVIDKANAFLATMEMKSIVVNDSPGFISNRVMLMYINEAIYCVQEDVTNAEGVDGVFRDCLSHPMGPLQLCDLIGLDTILYSLEVLYKEFNDSKYRPCYLLRKMVDAGQLGRKSGQGFYKY